MNAVDKKIFELIDILIFTKKVKNTKSFCDIIQMQKQNIRAIKLLNIHFTLQHVLIIIEVYKVNANWIFGLSENIFTKNNNTFSTQKNKKTQNIKN